MTEAQNLRMKIERLSEKRAVQLILERFHELESSWNDLDQRRRRLRDLRRFLASLNDVKVLKDPYLAGLDRHIKEDMDLTLLWSLIVPVERVHSRTRITDETFLPRTDDRPPGRDSFIMPVSVVLENFRSAFNIGGIFRTGECVGIEEILLCGYSATPENGGVGRSAMGCEKSVPWSRQRQTSGAILQMKNKNRAVIALETLGEAPTHHETHLPFPCALLLGNERFGLNATTLAEADMVVRIPTYGSKNSLNVVAAFAVWAYEARRQWEARLRESRGLQDSGGEV
jgi:tRNA(Leu) C34 or U34 (ribose-2'-O)-methylase TrmL